MDLNNLLASLLSDTPLYNDIEIQHLSVDSRSCLPGSLFLAYPGHQSDGRDYIDSAIKQGSVACVYDPLNFSPPNTPIPLIPINNLSAKVSLLADTFYHHPSQSLRVFGVTGTNGKTTITHALAQAFSHLKEKTSVIGTLGQGELGKLTHTGLTTPDAVSVQHTLAEHLASGITHVAMELSSHALHQHRAAAVDLDAAITTAVTQDHLDYHGSFPDYIAAKERILSFKSLKYAVIFADDEVGQSWSQHYKSKLPLLTYGSIKNNTKQPDIYCPAKQMDAQGAQRALCIETPWGIIETETTLIGAYNLSNLLAVVSVLGQEGIPINKIASVIPLIHAPPGRTEIIQHLGKPRVILDYAHTPDALDVMLKALKSTCRGQLLCVFGCGGDRDQAKRPLMGRAAALHADQIWLTSDNPRHEDPDAILTDIQAGCQTHPALSIIPDRETAIHAALANGEEHDTIVIAGKGHECYQQIADKQLPFSDQACVKSFFEDSSLP